MPVLRTCYCNIIILLVGELGRSSRVSEQFSFPIVIFLLYTQTCVVLDDELPPAVPENDGASVSGSAGDDV